MCSVVDKPNFAPVMKLPQRLSFRSQRIARTLQTSSHHFFYTLHQAEDMWINVPDVRLSADLALATVFVDFRDEQGQTASAADKKKFLMALKDYEKQLRKHWADTLGLRRVPHVRFRACDAPEGPALFSSVVNVSQNVDTSDVLVPVADGAYVAFDSIPTDMTVVPYSEDVCAPHGCV